MQKPTVSFIVPCYKLAHLLPECINSILGQTYGDFEVLVMDDCSPDNTAEVASSFSDPRVKYILNAVNLGHLRNYNEGIRLSSGKYVWLISADDYLKSDRILEKYVKVMDHHPKVGYVFCRGHEGGYFPVRGDQDRIIPGRVLLKKLLRSNFVLAASGMARRECYEKVSYFPLDMPYAGDWYLWCVYALHYDVGYFAEPMVYYRKHELSMTSTLMQKSAEACCEEDVAVPWSVKKKADESGNRSASLECLDAVSEVYARNIASKRYGMTHPSLTMEQFEESLCRHTENEAERVRVRGRVYAGMGNEFYWQGRLEQAKQYYKSGLTEYPWMPSIYLKKWLLSLGKRGDALRKSILSARS
jgi:glycosyltransferase involved in cell wall biosynthesis